MIDHLGFSVSDYERAKAFYAEALAPLGYGLIMEVTAEQTGHASAAGFGADGKPDFWIGGEGAMNKPVHVAIAAPRTVPPSTPSTGRPSRRADATTVRPASARITIRTTMAPSCSILTATTSRPSATLRNKADPARCDAGTSARHHRCRLSDN